MHGKYIDETTRLMNAWLSKKCIDETTRLMNAWLSDSCLKDIAFKAIIIMPGLVLQKPAENSKAC